MIHSRGMEHSLDRQTLIDILENRAAHDPALPLFTFLEEGEREQDAVTAAALAAHAKSIAAWLDQRGLGDQRILLLFPQGTEFVAAFFGCIYAGAISIPAPMPDPSRVARTLPRLQGILADAEPAAVLTNREGIGMAAEVAAHLPDLTRNLQWLAIEDCPSDLGSTWRRRSLDPDNPAHLQYTSGSTALPKGTMITHANIIANSRAIQKGCRYTPESRSVVWEPYFHDDGLIQGLIQPIFTGFPCILMAPSALVARPDRWLRAISRYRATHTCGPNFAYELCRRKVTDEQRQGLDLSSLVHAQNAAEPVRAETLQKFFERFEPCGLRWNALSPNYGLAEATLMVSSGLRDTGPVIQAFDAVALEREGVIRPVSEAHPNARLLVSSGAPLAETVVAIVDPNTGERCAADRVGEILVKSPGIAAGYFRRPEESIGTFQARLDDGDGPYLRTGDQGFLLHGDVFVTGRIKDLIIIRGENRYPHDIELSVERSHPAISPGSIAAFAIESDNEERLVVVAEMKRGFSAAHSELFIAIRDAISTEHDLRPGAIVLLAPGTLPKTSSGKIQRQASRKAFLGGTLHEVARWTDTTRVESSAERTPRTPVGKSGFAIREWLSRYLATEFGMRLEEISLDVPFSGYGIDSALAVRLAADLGEWLGLQLPPVIAWNYPNIRALSRHLEGTDDAGGHGEARVSSSEPIAIIGAACRFPGGAEDLESFWRLLDEGTDAIGEVPPERWDIQKFYDPNPDAEGKTVSRWGGFLSAVDRFEPAFFELSPREAAEMDPQQRILLEVSWEALEKAGQTIAGLRGSNTGVYVGISSNEYQQIGLSSTGLLDPHLFLGTTHSTGVARLSYWLGLRGPNMPVNTACSSSLVAVHLACQALRDGECSMAVAGGVNLILSPEATVCLSQMRALSPTGRCHSFSMDADGYVRSEGCGMVVLKRLSDAQRDGDPILAVIRGTAVNQDGRSNGLTAPHGPAQEDVIRRALANAGVSPRDVGYVETHGTGTPLGDPIEVQALANVLGEGRSSKNPVIIGSVKTNIGHAESAAGIAGLLKVVLSLSHGRIPRSLHFNVDRPNPHVPWEKLEVRVAVEALPWTSQGHARIAGVSAFGFSGTNAHVIVEDAPAQKQTARNAALQHLLPLSAKTPEALVELAKSSQEWLSRGDASLQDITYTASVRRSSLEHRLCVVGSTREEMADLLGAFAAANPSPGVVTGKASQTPPKVVFVFSGQGSQWVGMGRQLYREEPVFRDALTSYDEAIRTYAGFSIVEELDKPEETSRIHDTIVAQPALFAVEVALAALLKSWGVVPSEVIGHSVGEIAAAHVAGMLDLAQAARLVCVRARVMQKATGHGKMVSVSLSEDAARKAVAGFEDRVGIAAVNDPDSVVLSGDIEALDSLVEKFTQQGVQTRLLRVNYAFHSPQMEALIPEFTEALGDFAVKPAAIPMISTVTGKPVTDGEIDVGYWGRNIRQTVRFADAIAKSNEHVFVEMGPHPVLAMSIEQTLVAKNITGRVIPTLRRNKDERQQALFALGALHTAGVTIDWKRLYPESGRVVELPTYPWQKQRYWLEATSHKADLRSAGLVSAEHPLLGVATPLADGGGLLLTGRLSLSEQPWLMDHAVFDQVVVPGTGVLELAFAGARAVGETGLSDLTLEAPLLLPRHGGVRIQMVIQGADGVGRRVLSLHSQSDEAPADAPWTRNATGILAENASAKTDADLAVWPPAGAQSVDVGDLYPRLAARGYQYGPAFQGLTEVWRRENMLFARAMLPEALRKDAGDYGIHPALLDAALHALLTDSDLDSETVRLPFAFSDVALYATGASELRVRFELPSASAHDQTISLAIADGSGQPVARLGALQLRSATAEQIRASRPSVERDLYRVDWVPIALTDISRPMHDWVLGGDGRWAKERGLEWISNIDVLVDKLNRTGPAPERLLMDATWAIADEMPLPDVVQRETADALKTLQSLLAESRLSQTSLIWLTRGAIATNSNDMVEDLARASLWGLIRSARSENPERVLRLIDIDGSSVPAALFTEISEPELVWRYGTALAPRLQRSVDHSASLKQPAALHWRLHLPARGSLGDIELIEASDALVPLHPGQVRIAVHAAGVNFRDALNALGMVPAPWLGLEVAGTVVEVGPGVEHIAVGNRVMGLGQATFGTMAIADARLITRIPTHLSYAEAATIPLVFLTALYALHDLGGLQSGERLLVHAAAGGVGMAAIQMARHFGVEVFGTASPGKWHVLQAMGLDAQHIANSRDLSFADTFLTHTGGEGVDVVLNALAREFVDASLRLLPRGGRFLEMGKTDIRDAQAVATAHPGVRYRAFDLMEAGPERIQSMLEELAKLFEQKALSPLPLSAYDLRYAPVAFKHLANGRHVGKLILQPPRPMDSNGTALITGGTGELGQLLAKHLVQKYGVKHLVLTSRRGARALGADSLVNTLKEAGAETVTIAACDIGDSADAAALIQSITADKPLRAVFHLAGLLDDGLVTALTEERLANVLRPKVAGAWNLHQCTRDLELTAFVLFSSASGVMGSAGQANYAAANTFLDALAAQRRKQGLAGQSLAWGFWEQQGVGMTAHLNAADVARMQRQGLAPISVETGLALLDAALTQPEAALVPIRLELTRMQKALGEHDTMPPLLRGLVQPALRRVGPVAIAAQALRQRLMGLSENERREAVLDLVCREIAAVLGLAGADAVPADRPLQELGLDSLMAVELRNRLAARAETTLPATLAFEYPTPEAIAGLLLRKSFADLEPARSSWIEVLTATRPYLAPLSPDQARLAFLDRVLHRRETYSICIALHVDAVLDPERMQRAVDELIPRYDQLRMHLVDGADGPMQRILPWVDIPIAVHDLRSAIDPHAAFADLANRLAAIPFDLYRAPLMAIALARLSAEASGLVLVWHHIATDGWSLGMFFAALSQTYQALEKGPIDPTQVAAVPSFVSLMPAQKPAPSQHAAQVAWWREQLAGAEPLELPLDHRRGAREPVGKHFSFLLAAPLAADIERLGRVTGTSPFAVLLTAWATVLKRHSGQRAPCIGIITSGRTESESRNAIGLFVKTLPLRMALDEQQAVTNTIVASHRRLLEAMDHQELALGEILSLAPAAASLGASEANPLLRSIIVLEEASWFAATFAGAPMRTVGDSLNGDVAGTAKFELSLALVRTPNGFRASLEYRADLFDSATIQRLSGHLRQTLQAMIREPANRLGEIDILTAEERHQILVEWNDTARPFPQDVCVHQIFEQQVAKTPDAIAVVSKQQQLTYAELNTQANRLAHHLRSIGVGPEVRVGICLERSAEMLVAMLAVLKAGGAYVPLDSSYPVERLWFMAEDSGLRVLLMQSNVSFELPAGVHCVDVFAIVEKLSTLSSDDPENVVVPENAAYVIYTSGSTGKPKGVELSHRGGVAFLSWVRREFNFEELSGVVASTSISFDVSFFELFAPFILGGAVLLVPDALSLHTIDKDSPPPTMLVTVPSAIRTLLEGAGIPQTIRALNLAGEALDGTTVDAIYHKFQWVRVVRDLYGPTEDTTYSTCAHRHANGAVTIGRPIDNGRAYIIDGQAQAVPIGVAGELFLSGSGLARGYLNRPALTAERFLPDPFGPSGSRMYRTGDLCRWRLDGNLEYLGRIDHQVKIRGFRIELGEIETALSTHSALKQCVVVARKDGSAEVRLVAYIVGDALPSIAELREHLHTTLPDYMIPSAFVVLDALPLTPNGKVDRKALPAPEFDRTTLAGGYVPPGNGAEAALVEIWSAVLGVPRIGVHDNFFELGGDSILTIQVVSRAARAGITITPRQLFERQTIAALAAIATPNVQVAEVEPGQVWGDAPFTPIQRWFFAEQFEMPYHWNQAVCLEIPANWSVDVLARALHALVVHHYALRLAFDGLRATHVEAPESVPVEVLDLSAMTNRQERDRRMEVACTRLQSSMHLQQPPLLRAMRVDRGEEGIRLVVAIHHLVVDGVSWQVLLDDLRRACLAITEGRQVHLGTKTTAWKTWAEAQRDRVAEGAFDSARAYWEKTVNAPVASLPMPAVPGVSKHNHTIVQISPERTAMLLREAGKAYRTEINDILLCALALALKQWTGGNQIGILLEGHGREEELLGGLDVSRTVGWFTTMFPVRIELVEENLGRALKSVKEQLRALPHKGASYGMLRWLSQDGERLALPERGFDVVFNYLGQVRTGQSGLGANAGPVGESVAPENHATSLIGINGLVAADALQMRFDWNERHFAAGGVEALARSFHSVLDALIAHCISSEAGGLTPSDVALAEVDQETLDRLSAVHPQLVDLYPATPMQVGLLFHALHDPESPAYFEQLWLELRGDVDEAALEWAFARVVARHPILRTALVWQNVPQPLQAVMASVKLHWERVDWQNESTESEDERVSAWLGADRARGFTLDRAPLMRFAWLRFAPNRRVVVWSHHHVLMDGWSLPVVIGEVLRLYAAKRAGEHLTLPDVAPYRRYIAWLVRQDQTTGAAFWRDTLGDITEPFRLDLPAASSPDKGQGDFKLTLERPLTISLQRFARDQRLTLNTLLQGAWALLLSRYTRRDDVCFGVTVSGRPPLIEGIEQMVGLLINTLPLRTLIDGDSRLVDWLLGLQTNQALAREHETMPLAEVQRLAGIAVGTALFDTLLVFENYPMDPTLTSNVGFELANVEMLEQTNYLLTAAVIPGDEFRVRLTWDRSQLDEKTIRRLAGHLRQLLISMTANPTRRLSELEMLTPEERHQILVQWNDTARPFPQDVCVHQLFEQQVAKTPNAIAVVFEQQQLTYAELNTQANRWAHHLRSLGVGPEVRVGICLERSAEVVVAILGVLKAGGVYVPLDPSDPAERLRFMAEDAGLRVLVIQSNVSFQPPASVHSVDVSAIEEKLVTLSSDNLETVVVPENIAYAIYTSGSTGKPKAVCALHRSVINLITCEADLLDIRPGTPVLQFASIGFDASVSQILSTLSCGGCLVLVSSDSRRSKVALMDLIRTHRIEVADLPPSALALLDDDLHQVRVLMVGGEACPTDSALRFAKACRFVNAYGPTETTVTASYWDGVIVPNEPLPIGGPSNNNRIYVLSSVLSMDPIGVPGEIYIAGVGVARGYLNRPGLTAERFLPDPFGPPGSRMYRTGDLCRWRPDGNLEFLGRIDHQVKIRGFRIELREIEDALSAYPAINQCVVLARKDGPAEARLVAYIVGDALLPIAELRTHLATTLPDYMIPSAFVVLEALPLTPNGKVDRKALPVPEFDRAALSVRFVAARTRIEATLATIWAEMLGVGFVGIHDNFFELGGNSLSSIRLIGRAAEAGLRLTVRQLFASPTIEGLAKVLATKKPSQARCLISLRPNGDEIPLVLTPGLAGTSLVFLSLRDALRTTIPIWSFDEPHLARHSAQPETIEELAHLWVTELLEAMPDTPAFRLGGYSFGGMVAVEMARQLTALGKVVERVLILDGGLPNNNATFQPLEFAEVLAKHVGAPLGPRSGDVETDIEAVLKRIATALGTRQDAVVEDPLTWARATVVAAENNHKRMSHWHVRSTDTPITVLRASGNSARITDLGWSDALGHPVQVLFVPGEHETMTEPPFVQTLALCIDGLLAHHNDHSKRRS